MAKRDVKGDRGRMRGLERDLERGGGKDWF